MRGMTLRGYQNQIDSINMTLSLDAAMSHDQQQALRVRLGDLEREMELLRDGFWPQEFLGHPV
jgi:hypothetical protein